jgi:short-subunit dehydrogenase
MSATNESFAEKVVLITGASSGIGKALSLQLAKEGAWLALAARDSARLAALGMECEQLGGRALAIPTDVSDESQCQRMIQQVHAHYGRIDMLINNAGMSVVAKLDELPDLHLFKQVMDVNFYGMVHCTFHALPHLKASRGRIVNVSSLGGLQAIPYNSPYVSSKFAMNGFSDSLRMELINNRVSVTLICPYWVVTEFHERYLDKNGNPKGRAGRAIYTKDMMTAEQCAQIIIAAARRRKRQVIMSPGVLGMWMKLLAPDWMDRLTVQRFLKPVVKRIQETKQHDND